MGTYVKATGFTPKRADDIKEELEAGYRSIYGSNVNLEPESTNGQEIGVQTETLADIWDLLYVLYSQFDLGAVSARVQELLYQIIGVTRNQAVASTADLEITGTEGTIVDIDFQARNANGLIFKNTEDDPAKRTIDVSGTVTIPTESLEKGPYSADPDTITIIVTEQIGIASVTNPAAAVPGRLTENDALFRLRAGVSTSLPGQNTMESLFSQLADIDEVTQLKIYQNRENYIDPAGLPPHSFMALVIGGDDDEIIQTVWQNTPEGIQSQGNVEQDVVDPNGELVVVRFERPAEVDIYVDITTSKGLAYPGDGDTQIRDNILDYALGLLYDKTNFSGFGIDQDILYTRLYQPVNLVSGHNITKIEIGEDWGSLAEADIDIPYKKVGVFSADRIRINGVLP